MEFGFAKLRREAQLRTEPYGDVLESMGVGGSSYGFAGEWTDATGLQYLRARYYNTGIGRFTTRDTYEGDYQLPITLNRWMYGNRNPVLYTDPSGYSSIVPDCDYYGFCTDTGTRGSSSGSNPGYQVNRDDISNYLYGGGITCNFGNGWENNGIFASIYGTGRGWEGANFGQFVGNHLLDHGDDYFDLFENLFNISKITFETNAHQLIIRGGIAFRAALGMVEKTNIVNISNAGKIFSFGDLGNAVSKGAQRGVFSFGTAIGIATDWYQDYHNDEYNKYEKIVAYTADAVANIGVSAASGAVAAATTATIAAAGAPMAGLLVGAAIGFGVGWGLKAGYDAFVKEPLIETIAPLAKKVMGLSGP